MNQELARSIMAKYDSRENWPDLSGQVRYDTSVGSYVKTK